MIPDCDGYIRLSGDAPAHINSLESLTCQQDSQEKKKKKKNSVNATSTIIAPRSPIQLHLDPTEPTMCEVIAIVYTCPYNCGKIWTRNGQLNRCPAASKAGRDCAIIKMTQYENKGDAALPCVDCMKKQNENEAKK